MPIHIVLADDHQQYRQHLRNWLDAEPDLQVIAEAADGSEALEQVRELAPEVVLMDVAMPGVNGIQATRRITAEFPAVRVLALSLHADRQFVAAMFEAGASGYLLKDGEAQELVHAIRSLAAGRIFLDPKLSG